MSRVGKAEIGFGETGRFDQHNTMSFFPRDPERADPASSEKNIAVGARLKTKTLHPVGLGVCLGFMASGAMARTAQTSGNG